MGKGMEELQKVKYRNTQTFKLLNMEFKGFKDLNLLKYST